MGIFARLRKSTSDSLSKSVSLSSRYWEYEAAECIFLVSHLTAEVSRCDRSPERLAEQDAYEVFEMRLKQSKAFGQHLQRLPQDRLKYGQYGMYGTSSGLELLCMAEPASTFLRTTRNTPCGGDVRDWATEFLKAWNFFDLAIFELSGIDDSRFLGQWCTVLRTCHVLRAVGAARPFLAEFADEQKRYHAGCDEALVKNLHGSLTIDTAQEIARVCFERLREAQAFSRDVRSRAFSASVDPNETTFCFACGAQEVPETWKDWVFVWSSVLVAVTRAAQTGILTTDQVEQICGPGDIERLISVLKNTHHHDARYRLFGLWALDNLSPNRYGDSNVPELTRRGNVPQLLIDTTKNNNEWLETEIRSTCEELLRRNMLTDSLSQYQVYFSDKMVGERYWYDYYVIPVLPILLDLVAVHKPDWLFRPRVAKLVRQCINISNNQKPDEELEVLPAQVGNFNGMVNLVYYCEAFSRIASAISKRAGRAWFKVPIGVLLDHPTAAVTIGLMVLLISFGIGLMTYIHPESIVIAFLLLIVFHTLAITITHMLTKRLYERH